MTLFTFVAPSIVFWLIATLAETEKARGELMVMAVILAIFGGAYMIRDLFIED